VLVREAHARALPESDSDFDVFLNVWLTSQTEFDLAIKEIQLTISAAGSSARFADRISGDLDKWHLGKEREQTDMWDTYVETALRECAGAKYRRTTEGWHPAYWLAAFSTTEYRSRGIQDSADGAVGPGLSTP
jgi:hypothetical protein